MVLAFHIIETFLLVIAIGMLFKLSGQVKRNNAQTYALRALIVSQHQNTRNEYASSDDALARAEEADADAVKLREANEGLRSAVLKQRELLRYSLRSLGVSAQWAGVSEPSDFDKWVGQQERIESTRGPDFCEADFIRMKRDPDYASLLREVHSEGGMH